MIMWNNRLKCSFLRSIAWLILLAMMLSFVACANTNDNSAEKGSSTLATSVPKTEKTQESTTMPATTEPSAYEKPEGLSENEYFSATAVKATINEIGEFQEKINLVLSEDYSKNYGDKDWFGLFPETALEQGKPISGSRQYWAYVNLETDGWVRLSEDLFCGSEDNALHPGKYILFLCKNDSYEVMDQLAIEISQVQSEGKQELVAIESYGDVLYSFNLVGDFQFAGDGYCNNRAHLKAAMAAMKKYNPAGQFIVTVGDQVEAGLASQYNSFYKVFDSCETNLPMYLAVGNHDRYNQSYMTVMPEQYERFAGIKTDKIYYSFEKENIVFFMLGSELPGSDKTTVYISEEQYAWLEAGFNQAKSEGKIIFVIHHEPFYDTVASSLPGQHSHGVESQEEGNCFSKVKALCDTYNNCFVCSGHGHWVLSSKFNVVPSDGKHANYVNCSAVGYSWFGWGWGYTKTDKDGRYIGSEGYFAYVFKDKIVLRGWDFENDCFVRDFVFDLYT